MRSDPCSERFVRPVHHELRAEGSDLAVDLDAAEKEQTLEPHDVPRLAA